MRSKIMMGIVLFVSVALYGQMEEYGEITPFIRDSLTMVFEDGRKIVIRESYEDFMKKGFEIVEENNYYKEGGELRSRRFVLGPSGVTFDLDMKVRSGSIEGPGPGLLSGALKIGSPVEPLLKHLRADDRYIVETEEIDLSLNRAKPSISIEFKDATIPGYSIYVKHDKGKVIYISYRTTYGNL